MRTMMKQMNKLRSYNGKTITLDELKEIRNNEMILGMFKKSSDDKEEIWQIGLSLNEHITVKLNKAGGKENHG